MHTDPSEVVFQFLILGYLVDLKPLTQKTKKDFQFLILGYYTVLELLAVWRTMTFNSSF